MLFGASARRDDRVGPVYAIMRSAAAVDSEMSSLYVEMQGYRARNAKVIAGWIAKRGKLRVSTERASHIMWAVASPELASMLIDQQGWSKAEYSEWLEGTLATSLLIAA